MKETVAPSGKLYNWNTVCHTYKTIGVNIEADIKSLIIAGDLEMLNEVLKKAYNAAGAYKLLSHQTDNHLPKQRDSSPTINRKKKFKHVQPRYQSQHYNYGKKGYLQQFKDEKTKAREIRQNNMNEVVDLKKISTKTPLNQTVTSLEFLLVSISKHFKLKMKQVKFSGIFY